MRTTVTLDDDTVQVIRRRMREQKVSFKQAINDAIRDGASGRPDTTFRTDTAVLGPARINLDRALQLAAELEDEALASRLRLES